MFQNVFISFNLYYFIYLRIIDNACFNLPQLVCQFITNISSLRKYHTFNETYLTDINANLSARASRF